EHDPSLVVCLCGFFLYGLGDQRALHSFPTRRSSDLKGVNRQMRFGEQEQRRHAPFPAEDMDERTADGPQPQLLDDAVEKRTEARDRKSTRLNSSQVQISYAVFCLKKKKQRTHDIL